MNKLHIIHRAWALSSLSWTQTLNSTQILFQRLKQLHWMSSKWFPQVSTEKVIKTIESQNHGKAWAGRDHKDHLVQRH